MNFLLQLDTNLCISANRLSSHKILQIFFSLISRLGDGFVWYCMMLILPVIYAEQGAYITLHMLGAALPSLLIYKYLKKKTLRPRPCAINPAVQQKTHTLDQFSFPSGHTLHAVCFSVVVCGHLPMMLWVLVPFSLLVALSRPILGLHYPSDVLAGAAIGAIISSISWSVVI